MRKVGINGDNLTFYALIMNAGTGEIDIVVSAGKVTPGEFLQFQFKLAIVPTAASLATITEFNASVKEENKKRDAAKDRKLKQDLIEAVKERVEFAASIKARSALDLREEERIVVYRKLISTLMRDAWKADVDRRVAHLRSELVKALFDVDKMLYFVAPEWWQPRRQQSHQALGIDLEKEESAFVGLLNAESRKAAKGVAQDVAVLARKATRQKLGSLGVNDIAGWGGEGREDNYLLTEKSETAKLGSSLGWLLQLDGDNLRNAFLNAPWVKAVIPIRSGKERDALEWLKQSEVEGASGLGEEYAGSDVDYFAERKQSLSNDPNPPTNGEVLDILAADVATKYRAGLTPQLEPPVPGEAAVKYLPMDRVFEKGFDPLKDGFRVLDEADQVFEIFDQWTEILPTDQIVAMPVEYDPKTGAML